MGGIDTVIACGGGAGVATIGAAKAVRKEEAMKMSGDRCILPMGIVVGCDFPGG